MPGFILRCSEGADWNGFQFVENLNPEQIESLVENVNDSIAEQGIRVQAIDADNLQAKENDQWRRLRKECDLIQYEYRKYREGLSDDFPGIYTKEFHSLEAVAFEFEELQAREKSGKATSANGKKPPRDWPKNDDPAKFPFGPIPGNLKFLSQVLGQDDRTYYDQNGTGHFLIVSISSRLYHAWFSTLRHYEHYKRKAGLDL